MKICEWFKKKLIFGWRLKFIYRIDIICIIGVWWWEIKLYIEINDVMIINVYVFLVFWNINVLFLLDFYLCVYFIFKIENLEDNGMY